MAIQENQQTFSTSFSKLRGFLWPIHRHEYKKLIPMLFIFFFLSLDYNILRPMKDTLVVTAEHSGADVIPFIKVWAMFPMSVVLTYIFIRLSNRFSTETVFYTILSTFLCYFALFALFLYPAREQLHAHASANTLQQFLPEGMKGFVAMYRYWIFTSFYVMAELWGNIILFLLFWGFANQITKIDEAKRFYGLFGVGTNLSGIVAGPLSIIVTQYFTSLATFSFKDDWGKSMSALLAIVVLCGFITMAIFYWLTRVAMKDPRLMAHAHESVEEQTKKEKKKFSMRENIRFLTTSRYVLYIAVIVIAYNVIINLVEVLWKQEVRELHPDPVAYNTYMNEITTITGILATATSLFIAGNAIRRCGWTFTALITPIILLITSIGFFGFFFAKGHHDLITALFGMSPLALVVLFGSAQNCLSRAAKYTVFDATKEMTFVPLSAKDKVKAKAAIDGICNRLGKSGGSVIYQALLIPCGSITASVPYVGICLFAVIALWMVAVQGLGRKFQELTTPTANSENEREPDPQTVHSTLESGAAAVAM